MTLAKFGWPGIQNFLVGPLFIDPPPPPPPKKKNADPQTPEHFVTTLALFSQPQNRRTQNRVWAWEGGVIKALNPKP